MSDENRKPRNEGEGSRSADRRYREGVKRTLEKGDVEEKARRAAEEVEERPDEFRRAEDAGRERSAGEAPGDLERSRGDR